MKHRRAHALRRRYGRMYEGQRYHVTIKSPAGTVLERWGATQTTMSEPEVDIALRIAAQRPAGTIVEIRADGLVWRYTVGRVAGLPSVTRIKKGGAR